MSEREYFGRWVGIDLAVDAPKSMRDNAERWASAQASAQEVARLTAENKRLRDENFTLRGSRESAVVALKGEMARGAFLRLPHPREAKGNVYQLPLMVGDAPSLLAPETSFSTPYEPARFYRLTFQRMYGYGGDFWKLQPFCTEPER